MLFVWRVIEDHKPEVPSIVLCSRQNPCFLWCSLPLSQTSLLLSAPINQSYVQHDKGILCSSGRYNELRVTKKIWRRQITPLRSLPSTGVDMSPKYLTKLRYRIHGQVDSETVTETPSIACWLSFLKMVKVCKLKLSDWCPSNISAKYGCCG